MKKVLITGGAGFIGYHLAKKLLRSNYEIEILDNFSRGVKDSELLDLIKSEKVNLIDINLLDPKSINGISDDYFHIYHFAAVIGVQHVLKSPYSVLEQNFLLLNHAINIAQKQRFLNKFIFASTSEVYSGTLRHYGLEFPTKEETPLTINPLNEARTTYMLSKIYGEAMCLNSDLPVTIVRPHNFYGPRMGLSHVIPELMKKIIESESDCLDVYSVNHKRTFCYVADAVKIIQLLAESDKTMGEAYNIGNEDEEIKMGDLAEKIIQIIGKAVKVNPLPSTPGSPERRCPSVGKIKKVISYTKDYPLNKGLPETLNWYKENIFSGKERSAL